MVEGTATHTGRAEQGVVQYWRKLPFPRMQQILNGVSAMQHGSRTSSAIAWASPFSARCWLTRPTTRSARLRPWAVMVQQALSVRSAAKPLPRTHKCRWTRPRWWRNRQRRSPAHGRSPALCIVGLVGQQLAQNADAHAIALLVFAPCCIAETPFRICCMRGDGSCVTPMMHNSLFCSPATASHHTRRLKPSPLWACAHGLCMHGCTWSGHTHSAA